MGLNHLEPDLKWGFRYLEETEKVVKSMQEGGFQIQGGDCVFLEYIMLLVFEPDLEKSFCKISLDVNSQNSVPYKFEKDLVSIFTAGVSATKILYFIKSLFERN